VGTSVVTPGDPRRRGIVEQLTFAHWGPWEASARGVDGAGKKNTRRETKKEKMKRLGEKMADASAPLMTQLATLGRF